MKNYTTSDLMILLRERCDLNTQKTTAEELGMPPQFINDVIRGRRDISTNLANALGFDKLPDAYRKKTGAAK